MPKSREEIERLSEKKGQATAAAREIIVMFLKANLDFFYSDEEIIGAVWINRDFRHGGIESAVSGALTELQLKNIIVGKYLDGYTYYAFNQDFGD